MPQRTVLITGCSHGGIGSALAVAFHSRELRVFATARSLQKMSHLAELGINTMLLDVTSPASIAECVASVSALTGGKLDILVNNAGSGLSLPLTDTPLPSARQLFETNFFGPLAVIQAFVPLLVASAADPHRRHRPMIVNNTSVVSVLPFPFQGVYNASKAALASLSDTLRLELLPFDIDVVDLKTGVVKTQFFDNARRSNKEAATQDPNGSHDPSLPKANTKQQGPQSILPPQSIYTPASAAISLATSHASVETTGLPAPTYAEKVVSDLLRHASSPSGRPPVQVWRGANAAIVWFARRFLPFTGLDGNMKKMGNLDQVDMEIRTAAKRG